MPKTAPKGKKVFSLADYRAEATGEPYRLELDNGEVLEIARPTGATMMRLAELTAGAGPQNPPDLPELLKTLLGDQYERVMDVLGDEDFGVMLAVLADLNEFFGLGEAVASLA